MQAVSEDRQEIEGLKAACKMFISAGSIFGHLRDEITKDMLPPLPTDLTSESLSMFESLMFAQVHCEDRYPSVNTNAPRAS